MSTDADALYRLMSWLSPAFPVGAFSYSHGIEYAVEAGVVRDEESLRRWIDAGLHNEFGPVTGAMLRAAYEAMAARDRSRLADALQDARAFVATAEFELEHRAQGQAFMLCLDAAWSEARDRTWLASVLNDDFVPYPSAVGIAAAAAAIPLEATLAAFLHAVVGNLISAGIRLIPLGQTAGQRILAHLQSAVLNATDDVLNRDAGDVGSAAPLAEWASANHETQYTRLFRS
ncbi:MAG TPA: urease accessory UreF family protein [Rhizomicrobium sp.]|jgi:urease accessory protein|nr:urease accessory UreF family protein [Rhizomicrobium sp.]